ncbi:MAG: aminopeptidase P family protein [Chelatococcus sp.]|uniref:M24 family metallopeptidase n=1 Tax=Chelatococcus sp. TaxID=1953771 RepID=UPI0025C69D88|nr:Xaa-Pro peptidase family protein [Chelatococcus sp.]MBX3537778.1 aminopeptidase P family protein [Chelatococcus sp.]
MNAMSHQPRLERLRQRMEEAGIDVMLCFKPENSFYLTGFNPIIYSHPVVAILPREGKASMLVHALRDDHARASTFLEDIRLYGAWSTKVTMGPSWLEALKSMLTEAGFTEAVVGIEEDFIPMTRYRELQGILPGARFADVSRLVFETRLIKDADEIVHARAAAAIADVGMNAAVDAVRQGGNEREIAITSMAAMNRFWTDNYPDAEVCDFGSLEGGAQNGLWTWVLTNERIFMNCDNPTVRKPLKGEPVFIDIWTIINGIHAENERTVAVGTLPDETRRAIDSIIEIRESIVPLIKPGTPISELYAKARRGLEERGYGRFLPGRIGHGIGLGAHEGPSLDAKTSYPLEAGMLFTLEPNLRIPGVCGTQISDTVLVTSTGCEFLTRSPNGLQQA